jgi:SAM-dependent methyltransferase
VDRDFSGLLLLIGRLSAARPTLDQAALRSFAEFKLPEVAQHFDALLAELFARGWAVGEPDAFTLSEPGRQAVAQAASTSSLTAMFYDAYYAAVPASAAHSRFCAAVYGLDLCQHGMADMDQLHLALDRLGVKAGSRLFEFGCGDGRIAEYIAKTRGATVTGVDISGAIDLARARAAGCRPRLEFIQADILAAPERIPPGPFDAALAVDSFFFLPDQRSGLERVWARLVPGGKFAIFYIAPLGLGLGETALGQALRDLGRCAESIDLTAANRRHWEKKKAVLEELRADFLAEGSDFLYNNRIAECQGCEMMQRWLILC